MLLGGTQQSALKSFLWRQIIERPDRSKPAASTPVCKKRVTHSDEKAFQEYWAFKKDIQKAGVEY
jgi:hypothetical protein